MVRAEQVDELGIKYKKTVNANISRVLCFLQLTEWICG